MFPSTRASPRSPEFLEQGSDFQQPPDDSQGRFPAPPLAKTSIFSPGELKGSWLYLLPLSPASAGKHPAVWFGEAEQGVCGQSLVPCPAAGTGAAPSLHLQHCPARFPSWCLLCYLKLTKLRCCLTGEQRYFLGSILTPSPPLPLEPPKPPEHPAGSFPFPRLASLPVLLPRPVGREAIRYTHSLLLALV